MKKYIIASGLSVALFISTVASTRLLFAPNPDIKYDSDPIAVNRVVIDDEILSKVNERILAGNAPEEETTQPVKLTKVGKMLSKIADKSIADLTESEKEALTIYKKPDKNSKIKGYLPDGGTMTVLEQNEEWTKIKSGSTEGYVRTKYVVSGDKVDDYIIDNSFVSATVTKDTVSILSKHKKNSSAVGIGYKGKQYPVLGFSDDEKYVFIERTESISGWVSTSDVKLNLTAPKAMSKDEFEEYQDELEYKEQQALNSYLSIKISSTGNKLQDSIINLISHNESGNYKAARNPITSGEKTITVGAWQWYGENAHNILRLICNENNEKAKDILENSFIGLKAEEKSKQLYKDIIGRDNWESDERIFTKAEIIAIKELLGSNQGVKVQNSKIQADIRAKVRVAISSYQLTNDALVTYFCDLFWQNPTNARKIVDKCIDHYGSAKKFSKADDGLKYLHQTAMKNKVMSPYSKRRKYTYSYCKNLE